MNIDSSLIKQIGRALGREASASEKGSVIKLSEFTEADVKEFRELHKKVGGVITISFIRFKLKGIMPLNKVVSYYSDVVILGLPPESWVE
ncbi:hypothetical protein ONV78_18010 [Hahella sp. CR1]|uniref:hypothetical protein n=1 Tax=Hahella sp. CR1 TaxID=2992807 RepID=UPI002442E3A3|nr:hypothetical protein [Hahella sp. CR1]MDG9669634.1 hypothetical protein [Hahella sp. CR1]